MGDWIAAFAAMTEKVRAEALPSFRAFGCAQDKLREKSWAFGVIHCWSEGERPRFFDSAALRSE